MATKAEEIIDLRNRELRLQANIRSLWQQTANKLYPYVQIDSTFEPGSIRTTEIYDQTPMLDAEDMVSGLKQILIPSGQPFFAMKIGGENTTNDSTQRYVSMLTEASHNAIYASNFITEIDEVLRSLIIFGPATIFSEWTPKTGLNYKACVLGSYQFLENSKKLVDGIVLTIQYTPRQAIQEFGEEKVGKEVVKAFEDSKRQEELFSFIYLIRPRGIFNPNLSQKFFGNMPWEATVVNEKEKIVVAEAGFAEFPYHSARWKRPANEKHGRGIGTEILPQIKVLDRSMRNWLDVSNLWANPPREVLHSVDGPVRVTPGAKNVVQEMGSIKALDSGLFGNFPTTEASLDRQQDLIHRAFFKDAFSPLENLTGDRRTTLEIRERIKQAWHKIGPPVARVWYELLEKCVTRSILLLIRNGAVERPPAELSGINFGLEFVGPFALELRSQQAKAFQEWAGFVGEMEGVFPGATDNVDTDDAVMRMGRTFGVNAEDMASEEERDEKRRIRQAEKEAQLALQMAQVGAQAYQGATKAPEA
ncbi:hypothetical protein LCGC14_1448290, partial [marine sediment metagenome]